MYERMPAEVSVTFDLDHPVDFPSPRFHLLTLASYSCFPNQQFARECSEIYFNHHLLLRHATDA